MSSLWHGLSTVAVFCLEHPWIVCGIGSLWCLALWLLRHLLFQLMACLEQVHNTPDQPQVSVANTLETWSGLRLLADERDILEAVMQARLRASRSER